MSGELAERYKKKKYYKQKAVKNSFFVFIKGFNSEAQLEVSIKWKKLQRKVTEVGPLSRQEGNSWE